MERKLIFWIFQSLNGVELIFFQIGFSYIAFFLHDHGYVIIVERDFKTMSSFQAYARSVEKIVQMKQVNVVVTVGGDEEDAMALTLKVWTLDKLDKTGSPLCIKALKLPRLPVIFLSSNIDNFSLRCSKKFGGYPREKLESFYLIGEPKFFAVDFLYFFHSYHHRDKLSF